ncbi:MAG: 3-hydroxyacyl-ACP dehydratase FabZ family protein [Geobacter sp.]
MTHLLNPDPSAYLPHRYPFLMLDRVLEQQPGSFARARYRTSAALRSMPQVLLVEAVAQLSGVAAVERQGDGGFLATIDRASFGRPPLLGETLEVEARVVKAFGRLCLMEGRVTVADEELLNVTLTLGIGPL